ncbi:hypothetical protein [Neptuniibacter sp. QD37_11]|uniref:hypothetical protein n=1 Tax=Neptuniibacter sp. QD37_11 TaxID=3398209 RepID=UPI0039F4617A
MKVLGYKITSSGLTFAENACGQINKRSDKNLRRRAAQRDIEHGRALPSRGMKETIRLARLYECRTLFLSARENLKRAHFLKNGGGTEKQISILCTHNHRELRANGLPLDRSGIIELQKKRVEVKYTQLIRSRDSHCSGACLP